MRMPPGGELLSLVLLAVCIYCTNAASLGSDEDYPCPNIGFFTAPDSCRHYYECKPFKGSLMSVRGRCPRGFFDDAFSECRRRKFVTSPPRCVMGHDGAKGGTVVALVGDPPVVKVVEESSAAGIAEDTSVVRDVDHAAVGVAGDLGVVASDTPDVIQVDGETVVSDDDSPVPTERNVTGNDTELLEDLELVGQGVNETSNPLVNEAMTVNVTEEIVVVSNLTLCDHMNVVNSYATLIMSSPPLRESSEYQEEYNKNIEKFNRDLEEAKNDTAIWDNGDSVLAGIKKTIQMASEYKPAFDKKLKINQERIKAISEAEVDPKLSDELAAEIKILQEEIETIEQSLPQTEVPALKQYFVRLIASKRQSIDRKQREMKPSSKAARVLQEMIPFLGYVRDDGTDVEHLAKHCQERIDSLHENIEGHARAFEKYANRSDAGVLLLIEEEELKREELRANAEEHKRLENLEVELNGRQDALNNANSNIRQELSRLMDVMQDKRDKFDDRKNAVCKDMLLGVYGITKKSTTFEKEMACQRILDDRDITFDITQEEEEVRQLRAEHRENTNEINTILRNLTSTSKSLSQSEDALPHHETRLLQINFELRNLRMHKADLSHLQEGAQTARTSLWAIREAFQMLGEDFESFTREFESMMANAQAAEGDVIQQEEERDAIELDMLNIERQIDEFEVPDIKTCTLEH